MKYDQAEALKEILRRRDALVERRRRRTVRMLSCAVFLLSTSLLAAFWQLAGPGRAEAGTSVYGAFLLSDAAGGYVLIGVLAFVLGVAVTLLCLRHSRRQTKKQSETENKEAEETR